MAMSRETFNSYFDALCTICKAYNIEPLKTIDHVDRVRIELIGAVPQRPPIHHLMCDYMYDYEAYSHPYMEFDLHNATANVYDLIKFTRHYFNNSLDVITTNDIDKIWEELLMKNFTKNDLKNGDVVITRDGDIGVVVSERNLIFFKSGLFLRIPDINDDLTNYNMSADIMIVNREAECFNNADSNSPNYMPQGIVYDRESVEVEEMTLEQVCKALGKNIKIVKG